MKQCFVVVQISLLFLTVSVSNSYSGNYELKPPPESLSKYYPPQSETLEFTSRMTLMSQSVTAILLGLKSGDPAGADEAAKELFSIYKKTAKMVPEWKELFKPEKVKAVRDSLGSGDRGIIKKALEELEKSCEACHDKNRIPVWTKYHWPSFKKIIITDPENENDLKYPKYMESISHTFNSITIFYKKSDFKKAGKSLRAFKARFMELKSTCSKCHINSDVKKIFFGSHITDALSNLKKSLSADSKGDFDKNMEVIRKRGCKMCHLTHMTYSIIKTEWEEN